MRAWLGAPQLFVLLLLPFMSVFGGGGSALAHDCAEMMAMNNVDRVVPEQTAIVETSTQAPEALQRGSPSVVRPILFSDCGKQTCLMSAPCCQLLAGRGGMNINPPLTSATVAPPFFLAPRSIKPELRPRPPRHLV